MKKLILSVLMAFCSTMLLAQAITVKGTVISSEDGLPIIGAYVLEQGTNNGTSTDVDGKFVITVPKLATLVVSSVGYHNRVVPVQGRAIINFSLAPETVNLDEVMVVAYGTAKKGTYTGAASLVKADAIKDAPSVSFESALNGKVAGLQITQSSGQAGSASEIRIRGIGSMNASNEPLYVIDGVPVTSGDVGQMSDYTYSTNNVMSTLNPSDIESITVLKDAAASSLYGSRAANGVVMITTKKGKAGKPTVTLKTTWGFTPSWATDNYEVASTEENAQYLYEVHFDRKASSGEAAGNAKGLEEMNARFGKHGYTFATEGTGRYAKLIIGVKESDDPETNKRLQERLNNYFDWEDAYFRTAVFQTYDLSVSGGNENSSYYSSLAYTKDKGRVIENDFSRITARLNLTQKVNKAIELATNVNFGNTEKSGFNDTRNTGSNLFMQTRNLLWGFYWPTDYSSGDPWVSKYDSYAQNLLYHKDEWENNSHTTKLIGSETLTINILPELTLRSILSYENTETKDKIYYSKNHFNGTPNGIVHEMSTNTYKLVSSTTANYIKDFGEKHSVNVLAGFEAERNKTRFQRSTAENMPSSSLPTVATGGILDANGYSWGNSMVSILSKAEYNYDGRYYLSGSYRRDGSSRLSENSRWGDFWSVSGSWKINNEEWMKQYDWISNLRVRASYGINGTLPSNNYGWRSLVSYSDRYNGNPGGALSTLADENLTWETSYSTNIALEFGFWDQRLYGTVEYFNRDSKDLLQDVPISKVTGFSSVLMNIGEINNKGVEIEIGGDIIRTQDLTWDASITATLMKSKVTKLYDGQEIVWSDPTGGDSRADFIYREGESTLALYGYEWAGVDPQTGQNWYYSNNDSADTQLNGRNVVYDYNDANKLIIGDMTPDVYGGINTSVTWKGLNVGLNFIYKIGGNLYDGAQKDVNDDGYYYERTHMASVVANRWKQPGDVTNIPLARGCDLTDAMETTTRFMYDASFLRLKTVSVGYNLPKAWVNKVKIDKARVFFNGTNLFTWSKYDVADPEVNAYGTRGWETPYGKTYTFGLELTF